MQTDGWQRAGTRARPGPLAEVARELGATPDAVALAAALARPWAGRVVLGPATVAQLGSNLRAVDVALSPHRARALNALREPADSYWRRRATLPWT